MAETFLDLDLRVPAWIAEARCGGVADPDRFFPSRGQSYALAKSLCGRCPVQAECLQYAIDEQIEFGVWGGKTPPQRRYYAAQQRQPEPVFVSPDRMEKMLRLVRIRYVPRASNAGGARTAPLASASA